MMGLCRLGGGPARTSGAAGVAFLFGLFLIAGACSSDPEVPNPNGKPPGAGCTDDSECQSLTCKNGECTPVTGGNPKDGKQNGDETDVDCGGTSAPPCADGKKCKTGQDCASGACSGGVCKAPSPDDGIKNGDETDVDCGGSSAPKCDAGKACKSHEDCASGGCNYANKCADFPSCTGHHGGDTCGPGETGDPDAQHESCCAVVEDPNTGVRVGKYHVTAGRMRAFVERFDGNLRAWAETSPQGWDPSWTSHLPSSMDEALFLLGPGNKRGCNVKNQGGRTYWQEAPNGDADETSDFSKDVLDEKALNCVPWHLAQALCQFDGGRLISSDEVVSLIRNGGSTDFPWGNSPRFVAKRQNALYVHFYSYHTPNPPDDMRTAGGSPLDKAFFIAPPGRRPGGNNQIGVADAVGNVMPWVNDKPNEFAWTASWEEHGVFGSGAGAATSTWPPGGSKAEALGYYAIGARCVFE
jgi:formylglycine-generating enzyme required for sulfatase activity